MATSSPDDLAGTSTNHPTSAEQSGDPAEAQAQELKTCASIIAGWTELISRGLLSDRELRPACERIRQACARIVVVAGQIDAPSNQPPDDLVDDATELIADLIP